MYTVAVLAVSIAPVVGFLAWLLHMDRREPEPLGQVLKVVGLGTLSGGIALVVELALDGLPIFQGQGLRSAFLISFLQIAPIEEACKLAVVLLFVWKSPHFNEENDGIVYTGSSALGFALLENVAYVVEHGLGTAVVRAFSAIPMHMFTGVILGYHVGLARFTVAASARRWRVAQGFLVAWLLHGLYDTFAFSGRRWPLLVLPLLVGVVLYGVSFLRRGRALSMARWSAAPGSDGPVSARAARVPAASMPAASMPATPMPATPMPATPMPATPMPATLHTAPKAPRWMAVVARLLFGLCALLWVLLIIGMFAMKEEGGAGDILLGGALMTFIPLGLGIVLEASYHRRRARWKKTQNTPNTRFSETVGPP